MNKIFKERLFRLSQGKEGVGLYEELLKLTEDIINETHNETASEFIYDMYFMQSFFMNNINNAGWDSEETKRKMMDKLWEWGHQLTDDAEKYDVTLP